MKFFLILCSFAFSCICCGQITKLCDLKHLPEISGIVRVNGTYWGLNDGGNDAKLYSFDSSTGDILDSTTFANASNIDWEELSANQNYIFIGDFGNNYGTRKNLRIFRLPISELGKPNVRVDTISFYYPEQTNFNTNIFTNFDCEAMIALADSIYLFSKSYGDALCRIYVLPNKTGNYAAQLTDSVSLDFLVTGASYEMKNLALIGYAYNGNLLPKYLTGSFSHGRINQSDVKTKNLSYSGPNQVESILISGNSYLFSAETSNGFPAAFFSEKEISQTQTTSNPFQNIRIFPNPFNTEIIVEITDKMANAVVEITDSAGKLYFMGELNSGANTIHLQKLPNGVYFYSIHSNGYGRIFGKLNKIH